jgi:hypothetical protein
LNRSASLKLRAARQGRGLDGYERANLLDGYPDREWSYNLFASRAIMLIDEPFVHQYLPF